MATKPPPSAPAKDAKSTETTPAAAAGKKPRKKLFIIIGILVLILSLAGGGIFYVMKQRAAAAEADAEDNTTDTPAQTTPAKKTDPKTPPAYMPLDNIVINLNEPGGERVTQIGIIFELQDAHDADRVKAFMPTIRHSILLAISQRTAVEILSPEGKEALAKEIVELASIPFGGEIKHVVPKESVDTPEPPKKKPKKEAAPVENYPVKAVLFSSFIVQ